jgi:hypothetical protein
MLARSSQNFCLLLRRDSARAIHSFLYVSITILRLVARKRGVDNAALNFFASVPMAEASFDYAGVPDEMSSPNGLKPFRPTCMLGCPPLFTFRRRRACVPATMTALG